MTLTRCQPLNLPEHQPGHGAARRKVFPWQVEAVFAVVKLTSCCLKFALLPIVAACVFVRLAEQSNTSKFVHYGMAHTALIVDCTQNSLPSNPNLVAEAGYLLR